MKKLRNPFVLMACLSMFIPYQVHAEIPGLALNAQASSVQVDPSSGSAVLPIQIPVPPGRAGIEPKISLVYNSQNHRLGLAGVGWNFDFGSITVSTKSGLPKYNTSDTYLLDGNQLVPNPALGQNRFNLEIESAFNSIQKFSDSYWIVKDKKGTVYYYGDPSAQSIQYDSVNGGKFFRWALDNVRDVNGNTMKIIYKRDGGQLYPERIIYTGYEGANPSMVQGPHAEVKFEYQTVQYPSTTTVPGFFVKQSLILKSITTYAGGTSTSGGVVQDKYILNYIASPVTGRDLLASIQRQGSNNSNILPMASFTYTDGGTGFVEATTVGDIPNAMPPAGKPLDLQPVDVNGDGYMDLVANINQTGAGTVYINNKNLGWDSTDSSWALDNLPAETASLADFGNDRGIRLVDINGDGYVDVIRNAIYGRRIFIDQYALINDQQGNYVPKANNKPPDDTRFIKKVDSNPIEYLGTLIGDINGDGYPDIITSNGGANVHKAYLSDQGVNWEQNDTWVPNTLNIGPLDSLIDINGDGLPELGQNVGMLNNGHGWEAKDYGDYSNYSGSMRFCDLNGDGLVDIYRYGYEGTSSMVMINTGYGWIAGNSNFTINDVPDYEKQNILFLDANGDGMSDYIIFSSTHPPKLFINQSLPSDMLISVDNGIGAVTSIEYDTVAHTQNNAAPFPFLVVKSLTTAVNSQNYKTSYAYSGALWVADYHEFMGFKTATVTDPDGNYSTTEFIQDHFLKGRPKTQAVYDSTGKLYSKSVNDWDSVLLAQQGGLKSRFAFLKRTDSCFYDGFTNAKCTAQEHFYDFNSGFGDLIKTINYGEVDPATGADIGTDKTVNNIEYASHPVYWIDQPGHTFIQDHNGNIISQTWFFYDGSHNVNSMNGPGLLTAKVDWLGDTSHPDPKTTYVYDSVGNLVSSTDPLGNTTTIDYDSSWHIFPLQVTNALQQKTKTGYYGIDGVSLDDGQGLRGMWGQTKSNTDANNQTVFSTYDSFGRPVAQISPKDSVNLPSAQISYNISSDVVAVTSKARVEHGKGQTIDKTVFYDGLGRMIESKSLGPKPGQFIIAGQTVYNKRGLAIRKYIPRFTNLDLNAMDPIDASVPSSQAEYDAMGRMVKMTNADGTYSSASYDHWTSASLDENGHMRKSITDAFGRLVQKQEFKGADGRAAHYPAVPFSLYATTNYKYDALGNLTSVIDAHNNVTTINYDHLNHKISMSDPDMGNWSYGYDDNGNLLWQKDAKGQAISFKYDTLNRLLNKTDAVLSGPLNHIPDVTPTPATFNVSYNYDDQGQAFGQGRLGSVAYDNGQAGFNYDNLGREISSTKMINGISYGVSRQYDALNRLKQLEYPDSAQVIYLYNQAGQVNGVVDSKALIPPSSSNTLRKENVFLTWVEKNIFGVGEAHADVIPPTINIISPPIVNAGGISTVAWSDIANPTSMDWIGLFASGAVDTDYPKWIYVSCSQSPTTAKTADSCAVTIPPSVVPGQYEFRLFSNNGYTKLATSTPITVTPVPPATLSASPAIVNAGSASVVSWNSIANPTSMDWIGLFAEGAADTAYSKWIYVSCSQTPTTAMAEGSCVFAIPSSLIPGKYEFRLFANNGSTKLATSAPITVASPAILSVSPASVISGGTSTVSWNNIASPTPMDWIGLFANGATDTNYSKWIYVSCTQTPTTAQAAGSCEFTIPPSTAPGQYEFRIFANNGSIKLATSDPITVTTAIPAVISASPDNIDAGNVSTVTWSDIANPTAMDWIGLFANGAADTGYSKWIYVSCSQNATIAKAAGSCDFTIPADTVPGQYEFRLFANNGSTKLATSVPFTVNAVIPPVSKYVQDIDYNATGQMTQIKYGNGTVTNYTYDPLNFRLKRILTVNAQGAKVQDLNYEYDAIGQVIAITDALNTATQSFQYDEQNRLLSANGAGYGNKTYAYDEIGNIKQKDGLNYAYGTNGAGPHAVTSTSDGTIYDYDANGNMKSKQTIQGLWAYAYDAQNRLATINYQPNAKPSKIISQYSYDGDGGRTKKVVYRYLDPDYSNKDTTDLLETQLGKPIFSGNEESAITTTIYVGNVYEIEDASSTGAGLRKTKNVYLGSTRVAAITGDEIAFYHQDHLGSGNVMTDQAGLVRSLTEYDPFGKISRFERYGGKIKSGWNYFNDKPLDDESGLIYYGARYYDPKLGRFITPDTIVQSPGNPQTLNRYTYCNNNPINLIDPTGHKWKWGNIFKAIGIAIVGAVATVFTAGLAAPALLGAFWGGVVTGAVAGATIGGAFAAATGGNIGMGMLTGAISGAIFGGIGGAHFGEAMHTFAHFAGGAASGAINGSITGGDIGMNALIGGISAGVTEWASANIGAFKMVPGKTTSAYIQNVVQRAALGGLVGGGISAASGGSFGSGFANGAMTSAISYTANEFFHLAGAAIGLVSGAVGGAMTGVADAGLKGESLFWGGVKGALIGGVIGIGIGLVNPFQSAAAGAMIGMGSSWAGQVAGNVVSGAPAFNHISYGAVAASAFGGGAGQVVQKGCLTVGFAAYESAVISGITAGSSELTGEMIEYTIHKP